MWPTTRTTFAGNDKKREVLIRLKGAVTGFFDAMKAKTSTECLNECNCTVLLPNYDHFSSGW